jgi:glycosyltransferase involved in cell wall biosynthesis
MEYKYKISVVIPVYNVGKYLSETIDSVIKQTIGFKKNIQIILINDGSQDNSEEICLKYKKKYPENIEYYSKKNAGVSAARNEGMKHIKGKYVNFLDSDDKFDLNAYEKAYRTFY